jgi:hypothetical protein
VRCASAGAERALRRPCLRANPNRKTATKKGLKPPDAYDYDVIQTTHTKKGGSAAEKKTLRFATIAAEAPSWRSTGQASERGGGGGVSGRGSSGGLSSRRSRRGGGES